jgi:hypothetical protein
MAQERRLAGPRRMKRLHERIETWRSTRKKLHPMPARLWCDAATLARELGVGPVVRVLGLNYQSLKRHMAAEGVFSESAEVSTGEFVELDRTQVLELAGARGPVVELSDARGVRLTVRFAAGSALNLAELVEVFRGRPG